MYGSPQNFSLWIYPQRPDGTLGTPTQVPTTGRYGSSMAVTLLDIDADTDLDVAVSTTEGVELFAQAGGTVAPYMVVPVPDALHAEAADLSGDGLPDLVVNSRTGVRVWWQILGDFMPSPAGHVPIEAMTEIEVADVTGDGRGDVVGIAGTSVWVSPQLSDHSFGPPAGYPAGGDAPWAYTNGLAVGDLDGDGRTDVAVSGGGNSPNSWVSTRLQLPDGTLGEARRYESYDIPETIEAADVTGDGRDDLVVLHGGWNRMGVYVQLESDGLGGESLHPIPYASHYDVKGLAVGDVSGDGLADVTLGDYNHGLVLLRGVLPDGAATAPDTSITSGPTGSIRSTSATFTFTSSPQAASYECALDGPTWAPCSSPVTVSGLATNASHTFRVRGVSAGGLVDNTPASHSFSVEAAADLSTSLTAAPNPAKRGSTLGYTVSVTNRGPDAASQVVLSLGLPAGVSVTSVSTSAGSCTYAGTPATVRCGTPTLVPGAALTATVRTTVTASKGTLVATAVATTPTWELDGSDDAASVSTRVGSGKG